MKMRVLKATNKVEDIEKLKPVALQWKVTCNGKAMGIELVPETHFADLAGMIDRYDADLFLLINDKGRVIGYMGIVCFNSPLSNQRVAQEHYWYVIGENRGKGSMLLIRAAKEWAKEKGCSHIILNASTLASNLHDRLCQFYERIGFQKFETSYIKEI